MTSSVLTDPRDRAIAEAAPTITAPIYGDMPWVPTDRYRFVHASNGVFLEARSRAIYTRIQLTSSLGGPYGPLEATTLLAGGPIPKAVGDELTAGAIADSPNEWAGLVVYDHQDKIYRRVAPEVKSRSPTHIDYQRTIENERYTLVVDAHSHGQGEAGFSPTDDADDIDGICIAVVIGGCHPNTQPHFAMRLVVYGRNHAIDWLPWGST